ncbi:membrane protein insertion efficiency factor YidD [Frankia sp. CcI156]|nr:MULTISPECIES: membrane protein insertion efficiency factor YidD [Frankia]ABD13892.1 protein of unknown function DUF37 [Frankia casuarinae]ETA03946.1 hypothetical protein CcI6DRAFT_00469 [Frankia sp. CcI6]EYT94206.1 hypothetical protein ThrDRAFT_00132 [Frankia casuarinae]KDA42600.1 hypothetical protein BMG523Draft_02577 [Frankia sp. BMG5.23]KFB06842.1 putative membrane protein insertion efficiency factor [Frankia sp. Allo2]
MTAGTVLVVLLATAAVVDLLLASRMVWRRLPRVARNADGAVRGPLSWTFAGLVRLYRAGWSARNAGLCRFEPSCSAYALAAVRRHGGVRGGVLAVARLLRCQPLAAGGYDPVPGTDPGPGIVRRPRGATADPGGPPDGRSAGDPAVAVPPVHRHGPPSPSQGMRAEIVGSGRGPWV